MAQPFDVPLDAAEFALLDTNQTVTELQDEDDIFQCGRCKKQFTALQQFINHKSSCRATTNNGNLAIRVQQQPQQHQQQQYQTVVSQQSMQQLINKQQPLVVSSGGMDVSGGASNLTLSQGVILTDDLMSFTSLDPATLQGSTLQTLQVGNIAGGSASLAPNNNKLLSALPTATAATPNTIAFTPEQLQQENFTLSSNQLPTVLTVNAGNGAFNQIIVKNSPTKSGGRQVSNFTPQVAPAVTIQAASLQTPNLITYTATSQQQYIASAGGIPDHATGSMAKRVARMKMETEAANDSDPNNKKKLKCQYCDKVFTKNFDLQQHVRSHTGEKPFQCIVCGRAFAQKSNVKKHMQTHKVWPRGTSHTLPEQPPMELPADGSLTVEIGGGGAGGDGGATTELVQIGEDSEQRAIVIDNSFRCQYCGAKFKTYFNLKTHMVNHKDQQVYKCIVRECGHQFRELDAFLEHTRHHKKDMVYRCHMCSKHFPSLLELGVHQYSHSLYPNKGPKTGPKYFRCAKCNSKYATPEALQHHCETVTHSFPCKFCKKVFTCEKYLRRHLVVHGTAVEYVCPTCNKAFKTEHYLKTHLVTHSADRPFACDLCPAAFNRKDKLRRHQLVHESSRRFKCPFRTHTGCTKEFNRQDKLKCHIISHSGIKPYKCERCNKSFSRKPHLREHQRIHANDYRFVCEVCERGFLREKLYLAHKELCGKDGGDIKPGRAASNKQWAKGRPGRPRRKMITVTESSGRRGGTGSGGGGGGAGGGGGGLRALAPLATRHGRQRRPPARYADAADDDDVMGSLEEVVEASTKQEIDQVVGDMMAGQVPAEEGDQGTLEAALPDPILKVTMDGSEEGHQGSFVVLASGDTQDENHTLQNVLTQGDYVETMDDDGGVAHVANINFVQQQDGSLIYSQGEPITFENFQKAGLLQPGTNIATLVVDGNQVVQQSDGSMTLIGAGGDTVHGVQYVTSTGDAHYPPGTVTYVGNSEGGGGAGTEPMHIAVEYPGGDYQGAIYHTAEEGVEDDYVYAAQDTTNAGSNEGGEEEEEEEDEEEEEKYQEVSAVYSEAYQVGTGDPMLPAEGHQE